MTILSQPGHKRTMRYFPESRRCIYIYYYITMSRTLIIAVLAIFAATGCQLPLVSSRTIELASDFVVDGKAYSIKKSYECHHENTGWLSARGADWHVREGEDTVELSGTLEDGRRFKIVPEKRYSSSVWYRSFCEQTGPVSIVNDFSANLYLFANNETVESFSGGNQSSRHFHVASFTAKLNLLHSGVSTFASQDEWPRVKKGAKASYYSISSVVYEKSAWAKFPILREDIESKRIVWLDLKKDHPLLQWGENDKNFASRQPIFGTYFGYRMLPSGVLKPPLTMWFAPEGETWVPKDSMRNARPWFLLPDRTNAKGNENPVAGLTHWVSYKGVKIEVPVRNYFRLFYEPETETLIKFYPERIAL